MIGVSLELLRRKQQELVKSVVFADKRVNPKPCKLKPGVFSLVVCSLYMYMLDPYPFVACLFQVEFSGQIMKANPYASMALETQ